MKKLNIQQEIKVLQEYTAEANQLIEKINQSILRTEEASSLQINRIKKQIVEDIHELSQFTDKSIYGTYHISLSKYMEKDKDSKYPIAHFTLCLNNAKHKSIDCRTGTTDYHFCIIEDCHTYAPVYADGHWADEYPKVFNERFITNKDIIEVLCMNWDSLLIGAYEEIKKAYQKNVDCNLKNTLLKSEQSRVKFANLSKSAEMQE